MALATAPDISVLLVTTLPTEHELMPLSSTYRDNLLNSI
jgi:hypothetical protein